MSPRPHFIYVSPVLPLPADQGSRRLTLETARLLRELGTVTWVTRLLPGQEDAEARLRKEGFELALDRGYARTELPRRLLRRLRTDLRAVRWRRPRELAFCCTSAVNRHVETSFREHPDAVGVAVFWHCWRALQSLPHSRRVLILSDVEHLRQREAPGGSPFTSLRLRMLEAAECEAMRESARILTISDWDREAVASISAATAARTASWPVRVSMPDRLPEFDRMGPTPSLFVYGRWEADFNRDGLREWLGTHWPAIRARFPGCRLRVAGSGLPDAMATRIREVGGEWLGWIDDLDVEFAAADAVVVPLRYAGGVRYRLLEAMARGNVCICTPVAARGAGVTPGIHYLEADSNDEWLDAIELCRQADRSRSIRVAAVRFVRDRCSDSVTIPAARAALAPVLQTTIEEA